MESESDSALVPWDSVLASDFRSDSDSVRGSHLDSGSEMAKDSDSASCLASLSTDSLPSCLWLLASSPS